MKRVMKRKHYVVVGLSVIAVGFLTAFFFDHTIVYDRSQTASVIDAGVTATDKNQTGDQAENHSLILPIIEKLNDIFGGGSLKVSLSKIGEPWGTVSGLTMFRGSPTRSWYGKGPLPSNPKVLWRYPEKPMCSYSEADGVTKQWCGSGWTGQPVVWERPDGITEVIFGAYDGAVHFVNAKTGQDTRPKFQTGDLIKGSVTLDPDGYPLLYFGSRDNNLRILSLDGDPTESPAEVWRLNADIVKGKWNNDWDGNPVVVNDMLFEGGENSWFFVMKLNRAYGPEGTANAGKVTVSPNIIFKMSGYTDELIKNVGDEMVSIEDSVTFFGDRVYFANSGGRILGLDISNIGKNTGKENIKTNNENIAPIVFDYWVGDDVDATIVVDEKGMLYVAAELERMNNRSAELGQLIKLDPSKQKINSAGIITGDPYIWGVQVPKENMDKGGIWATPAIFGDYLYVATHTGKLLTVERETGTVTSTDQLGDHAWSSPIVIDDGTQNNSVQNGGLKLLVATCYPGSLRNYSLDNPARPKLTNTMPLASGACIESTPAVWKGQIFVGTRDGYFYSFADKK